MAFRISHNVASLNSLRNLNKTQNALARSLERLSSGFKVNTGKDGPAALVISEKMRAQIGGLGQAIQNAEQAVSLVQVAEGALAEVHSLLTSVRELAVHAANAGANDAASLSADQSEITNALATIDRIASSTQFGKKVLLDGSQGVQGTSSDPDVAFMSGTDKSSAGTYAINITTQAEQAIAAAGTGQTGLLAANETVTVSGVNITLTAGMNQTAVRDRINEFTTTTGVTASVVSTNLTLTSDAYGSAQTVTAISNVAAAITSSGIGTTLITDSGVDIAGTIGTLAATGKGKVLTGDSGTVIEGIAVESAGVTGAQGTVTITQNSLVFQVGANKGQTVKISMPSMQAKNLGTGVAGNTFNNLNEIDVTSTTGAEDAIAIIDQAIDQLSTKRGELGAFQKNTLESFINTLRITEENLIAAESVVRDTDFAKEMSQFTKNQILIQSGTAMMVQANVMPQAVLSLLG